MAASTLRLSNTYLGAQFRRLRTTLRPWRPSWHDWSIACCATGWPSSTGARSFTKASTANCKLTISGAKPPISGSKSSKLRPRSFWRAEHMKIVGGDLHTRYQQIAMLDTAGVAGGLDPHSYGPPAVLYRRPALLRWRAPAHPLRLGALGIIGYCEVLPGPRACLYDGVHSAVGHWYDVV